MGKVLPFRPRSAAARYVTSRQFIPAEEVDTEQTLREQIEAARSIPVTPTYCRHLDCRVVVSVEHPLPASWPSSTTCGVHGGTTENRYAFGDPA